MPDYRKRRARRPVRTRPTVLAMLQWLASAELPSDVRDCECSEVLLFKASVFLNFLTHGDPSMTFSSRCHLSRRTSRSGLMRLAWSLTTAFVDTACACLRGESEHCATAWANYVRRPAESRSLLWFEAGSDKTKSGLGAIFTSQESSAGGTTA